MNVAQNTYATFNVTFEPGELKAVAMDASGKTLATHTIRSAGRFVTENEEEEDEDNRRRERAGREVLNQNEGKHFKFCTLFISFFSFFCSPGSAAKVELKLDAPSPKTGTGSALVADGHDSALIRVSHAHFEGERS